MLFRASSHPYQINVFTVAGCRRETDLVQECAATHGDLAAQESIIEKRHHRPAQRSSTQPFFQEVACSEKQHPPEFILYQRG